MRKFAVCVAGAVLVCALFARADTTVSDADPATFAEAITNGGTILVTTPITITDTETFDGGSNSVVVSGGNTNSIFDVESGSLTLAHFTIENGLGTNGGAISVALGATLTVSNCIFLNNTARGADGGSSGTNLAGTRGGPADPAYGGAIFNAGMASIFTCEFFTNHAIGGNGGAGGDGVDGVTQGGNGRPGGNGGMAQGGGIYSSGSLLVMDSTFSGNTARGGNGGTGGAGGSGFVSGSAGNGGAGAAASGAGLWATNGAASVILGCTFANNTCQGGTSADGGTTSGGNGMPGFHGGDAFGGGVGNAGDLGVTNSTFYEDIATGGTGGSGGTGARGGNGGRGGNGIGGGLYNIGTVSVVNCTFAKSSAIGGTNGAGGTGVAGGLSGHRGIGHGGNIANAAKKKNGSFFLMNSIVGTNGSGGGGYGIILDGGFNISADKTIKFKKSSTSKMKTNPMIGDLADNGGPTETMALVQATNSPALDKLDPSIAPPTDQRGVSRPQPVFADLSDIGAFELDTNLVRILTQPVSITVSQGSNAMFSVTAAGAEPLFYQWYFNNAALIGITNSALLITNVQSTNAGTFFVVVSNSFNAVTSHMATLTVTNITSSTNVGPNITQQPASLTVAPGGTANFSVTATGTAPLFYQWLFSPTGSGYTNITGATNASLALTNVQMANQGDYFVTVTNSLGSTNSVAAFLTVTNISTNGAPSIVQEPTSQTVAPGGAATFSVIAGGTAPLFYQWLFSPTGTGYTNITAGTNASLTLTNVQTASQGDYFVTVTNSLGYTNSTAAFLTVTNSLFP